MKIPLDCPELKEVGYRLRAFYITDTWTREDGSVWIPENHWIVADHNGDLFIMDEEQLSKEFETVALADGTVSIITNSA